jgi:hypothetical protein
MSLPATDLEALFRIQEGRLDNVEARLDSLEHDVQTGCTQPCPQLITLEADVNSCSRTKDEKYEALSREMGEMGGMLNTLDKDMATLTAEVKTAGDALKEIARNTTDFMEVLSTYKAAKGAFWVLGNTGKVIVGIAAALTAWYVIANTGVFMPTK